MFFPPGTPVLHSFYLERKYNIDLTIYKERETQPRKGLNRAGLELWSSQALGQCNAAPPVLAGTQHRGLSTWTLGSGLVSQVPFLGDALGVDGDFSKINEKSQLFPQSSLRYRKTNCFSLCLAVPLLGTQC